MIYVYPEKDLRAYPGTIRGTEEWDNTYKIRTAVERDINHIKENLCLAGRRTQNEKTLHADLISCWDHPTHYSCSCRQNQTS